MFLPEIRFCGPEDVPAIVEANFAFRGDKYIYEVTIDDLVYEDGISSNELL